MKYLAAALIFLCGAVAQARPQHGPIYDHVPTLSGPAGGSILLIDGTSSLPGLAFINETNLGIFRAGNDEGRWVGGAFGIRGAMSNNVFFYAGSSGTEYVTWDSDATPALLQQGLTWGLQSSPGTTKVYFDNSANLRLASDYVFCLSSGTDADAATCDISLARLSATAASWIVRDGSTGNASLLAMTQSYSTGDANISPSFDICGGQITNDGMTARRDVTLPTLTTAASSTGSRQCEIEAIANANANDIKIIAGAGDTIRNGASVSAAAGYICLAAQGDAVRLKSTNDSQWVVVSSMGALGLPDTGCP